MNNKKQKIKIIRLTTNSKKYFSDSMKWKNFKKINRQFSLLFVIITLYVAVFLSCSQKRKEHIEWIPFTWTSDSVSGKYIEKLAINISATIDKLPHKFTMQLDLGALTTEFYGKTLNPYLRKYPILNDKLDTTKTYWSQGEKYPMFRNVNLQLGNVLFKGIDIGLFKNFGTEPSSDLINSEMEVHIGTIAPDLFQNKILIIDYKKNRIAVTETLPTEFQNAPFEKFEIKDGRIKIPFLINGKVENLMFDTGSSLFSLVTTKQNAKEIGGTEIVDSLRVPSWDKYITFYGLKTISPIMFGNRNLESSIVYYDEVNSFDYLYKSENIWGITGNAYFFNDVIIIDYKNNRFGVK